jgi:hypothetical protein
MKKRWLTCFLGPATPQNEYGLLCNMGSAEEPNMKLLARGMNYGDACALAETLNTSALPQSLRTGK